MYYYCSESWRLPKILPGGGRRASVVNPFLPKRGCHLLGTGLVVLWLMGAITGWSQSPGQLGFGFSSYTAAESDGYATLSVVRTEGSSGVVTVDYRTTNGTAVAGADYAAKSGTLTFADGDTNQHLSILLFDNTVSTPSRTVRFVLSNPTGGAVLGIPSEATLQITENDAEPDPVEFALAAYLVGESGGNALIELIRRGPKTEAITIEYATEAGGTATVGVDYLAATGTVAFAVGQELANFPVPIQDDPDVEGDETFLVRIFNPSGGAAISGPGTVGVTIEDNDFGPATLDNTFDPGSGPDSLVRSVAAQADGKLLVGGAFTMLDGERRNFVGRLNANGSVDLGFMGNLAADCVVTNVLVTNIFVTNIFGFFQVVTNVQSVVVTNCAPIGANGFVSSVAATSNERIVFGGAFSQVNGTNRNRVVRLLDDGNLDGSFDQVNELNVAVNVVVPLADGKLYVGGGFTQPAPGIARLKANGSVDVSFDPGLGTDAPVYALAPLDSGRVAIAGGFGMVNNVSRSRVARLNVDGSVDVSFVPATVLDGAVYALAAYSSGTNAGKILIGGDFFRVGGTNRNGVARLNPDGSLDASFRPGSGVNGIVYAVALQPDDKVVMGGDFTTVNGLSRNRIARLNADGALDLSWDPLDGANNTVYSVVVMPDRKIVIGGAFTMVRGVERRGVARLHGDDPEQLLLMSLAGAGGGEVTVIFTSRPDRLYQVEGTTDMRSWTVLGTTRATGSRASFKDAGAGGVSRRIYRVREVNR